jgi:hypothetical protein
MYKIKTDGKYCEELWPYYLKPELNMEEANSSGNGKNLKYSNVIIRGRFKNE